MTGPNASGSAQSSAVPAGRLYRHEAWVGVALLLAVVALTLHSTQSLRKVLVHVRASATSYGTEEAFYRNLQLLGDDYVILDRIRSGFPPGTGVSVLFADRYENAIKRTITRLWLGLLPQYPISPEGRLLVCPLDHCELQPGDRILERGSQLVLVERAAD